MATKTTKALAKSNVAKTSTIKNGTKFDTRILALIAVALVAVVGYLFIRFSQASTGTQWLPKSWSSQATEWNAPSAGALLAANCDYGNGVLRVNAVCTPLPLTTGLNGKTAFRLNDTTYVPGVQSKFPELRHKIPANLSSPSEYCVSYSSQKSIAIKWENRSVTGTPDYVVGGVAGSDFGLLPATNGAISTWCSGPYPAKATVILNLELSAQENTAFVYDVTSRAATSKFFWSGNELTPSGPASVSGTTLIIPPVTTPGGFKFTDMNNYGAGKYCYTSSSIAAGPNTKLEWVSQERRSDNDMNFEGNVLLPVVKSSTECLTVPAVSPGDSPRRDISFQITGGSMTVLKVSFAPASTVTVTPTSAPTAVPTATPTPVPTATPAATPVATPYVNPSGTVVPEPSISIPVQPVAPPAASSQ